MVSFSVAAASLAALTAVSSGALIAVTVVGYNAACIGLIRACGNNNQAI